MAKTDREGFALDLINNVMFGKLVTIFASVLDAAAINAKCPNWLIVDRINAKSPAAGEHAVLSMALSMALSTREADGSRGVIEGSTALEHFA